MKSRIFASGELLFHNKYIKTVIILKILSSLPQRFYCCASGGKFQRSRIQHVPVWLPVILFGTPHHVRHTFTVMVEMPMVQTVHPTFISMLECKFAISREVSIARNVHRGASKTFRIPRAAVHTTDVRMVKRLQCLVRQICSLTWIVVNVVPALIAVASPRHQPDHLSGTLSKTPPRAQQHRFVMVIMRLPLVM